MKLNSRPLTFVTDISITSEVALYMYISCIKKIRVSSFQNCHCFGVSLQGFLMHVNSICLYTVFSLPADYMVYNEIL